jgi:hypothetical protein
MSLGGQASWDKMTSLGGKLTAPVCHLTKFVNKSEKRTFLSLQKLPGASLTKKKGFERDTWSLIF